MLLTLHCGSEVVLSKTNRIDDIKYHIQRGKDLSIWASTACLVLETLVQPHVFSTTKLHLYYTLFLLLKKL